MPVTSMTETERKYDVDESIPVPSLAGLGSAKVDEPVTLRAVYYDTADGRLAAHRMTLRRRTGGKDAGWHLKTPSSDGRTEYHSPLERGAGDEPSFSSRIPAIPPAELVYLVRAIVRDSPLAEIARLSTQRIITTLRDASGRPLVELADDLVSATDVRTGILRVWREWEVELLEGAPSDPGRRAALLDAVEAVVVRSGAVPSSSASKLARATGRLSLAPDARARTPTPTPTPGAARKEPTGDGAGTDELTRDSPALEVVIRFLSDLVAKFLDADAAVRADSPDSVHAMRIVVRRLRGVLASVSDVLETEATAPVRAELRRLGDVLGGARDVEVRSQRSAALLDAAANGGTSAAADSPAEAVLRQRLVDDVRAEYGAHLTEVSAFIDSEEYGALLDDLDALVVRPPLTPAALAPAARTLRHALRRQRGRVDARLAALGPLGLGPLPSGVPVPQPGEAGLEALHSARKAARRLRYLCEAIGDGEGAVRGAKALVSKAGALGIAARRLQDVIGEHRDAVLFTGFLAEVIRECDETGHDPTAYRSLLRRELRNAEAALRALPAAVGDFASTP